MSSVDTAFLHGLTTQTDGLSVTFFPTLQCKACHKEFVNRKGLRSHKCVREEQLLRRPFERRRFLPVCVDVAERRDDHQYKKRGILANIGQEQKEQVKRSRLALTLEKDESEFLNQEFTSQAWRVQREKPAPKIVLKSAWQSQQQQQQLQSIGDDVSTSTHLHHGRQDLSNPEGRTFADHQSEQSAKYEETRRSRYKEICPGNVDCRIQGFPHSTVQKEDSNR